MGTLTPDDFDWLCTLVGMTMWILGFITGVFGPRETSEKAGYRNHGEE